MPLIGSSRAKHIRGEEVNYLKMLFRTADKASGKVLKTTRPLLVTPQQAYVRPSQGDKDWWQSTTTVWQVDELIKRRVRDWRRLTGETGHDGTRNQSFRADHD